MVKNFSEKKKGFLNQVIYNKKKSLKFKMQKLTFLEEFQDFFRYFPGLLDLHFFLAEEPTNNITRRCQRLAARTYQNLTNCDNIILCGFILST